MPSININGVALAFEERGNPNGPAIAFAHTLAADRSAFEEVASFLGDFRLLLLDAHGHGESGYPASLSLQRMAHDSADLLQVLEAARACWVGESMGGMIGLRIARSRPECLRALVAINASAQAEDADARAAFLQMSHLFREGRVHEVAQATLPLLFAASTLEHRPEIVQRYIADFTRERDREGPFQAALAVFEREDIQSQLCHIDTPTLVLSGEEDKTCPLPVAEAIARGIPNAQLQIIPDCGHAIAAEQPRLVAQAIRDFLEELR